MCKIAIPRFVFAYLQKFERGAPEVRMLGLPPTGGALTGAHNHWLGNGSIPYGAQKDMS